MNSRQNLSVSCCTCLHLRGILSVLGVLLLAGVVRAEDSLTLDALRELRAQAASRTRRVIINNDGNEVLHGNAQDLSKEAILEARTTALAGTHVDTISYSMNCGSFGLFMHATKVGTVFTSQEDQYANNRIGELIASGTDQLEIMAEFGRQQGIEVFCSFRMNDTHDAGPLRRIFFRENRLKQEHPEWLLGTEQNKPQFGNWTGADYGRSEIRDFQFRCVEEVCQNYDLDGVELDFFRHPVFFQRAAQTGTVCTQRECNQMTSLLRKIRQMTEKEGLRRGRPFLIMVRVPDSVEYSRAIGLDVEKWLQDGLIDLLAVAGYYQLNDWETSVALGNQYGVPVYPSLDETRITDEQSKALRKGVLAYRGRALSAWQQGASGVYLFNAFNPKSPIWSELGDPEALARSDHDYVGSVRGVARIPGGALAHQSYQHCETLNPDAPRTIAPGETVSASIHIGDIRRQTGSSAATVTLRLRFGEPVSLPLTVQLNGELLSAPHINGDWVELSIPPDRLRAGKNLVEVSTPQMSPQRTWTDLHCTVRWP